MTGQEDRALTVGELRRRLADLGEDCPITVCVDDGEDLPITSIEVGPVGRPTQRGSVTQLAACRRHAHEGEEQ